MIDAATKDEICWRLARKLRQAARQKGVFLADMTDDQKASVVKRHFRAIAHAVAA